MKGSLILSLLGDEAGNAILPNGVMQTANLEIDVPGFQPQTLKSKSDSGLSSGDESFV
jgi:hypothetical protein